ncbi:hypothetical protein GCM10020219_008390 [Nonomuraea dietziae]
MGPFELPDFYLPYPARLNPHVESARVHTKEWAREMGMLDDPEIWEERRFDGMDYGLVCATPIPSATPAELDLVTDWYVWGLLLRRPLPRDVQADPRRGGRPGLSRQARPVHDRRSARAVNAVERGLKDLWARTVPGMSRLWRERFTRTTHELMQESMWELCPHRGRQVSNPIEYIEERRKVGGAPWSACLVEHAVGVEVPEQGGRQPPDQGADGDLRRRGAPAQRPVLLPAWRWRRRASCPLRAGRGALPRLRHPEGGRDHQRSADSRMHVFEHTTFTELPVLFVEYALPPHEQEAVLRYARGLQDWQSGGHEWHMRSNRYMNGGGRTGFTSRPACHGSRRVRNQRHVPHGRWATCRCRRSSCRSRCGRTAPAEARRATLDYAEAMGSTRWCGTGTAMTATTWRCARPASTPTRAWRSSSWPPTG